MTCVLLILYATFGVYIMNDLHLYRPHGEAVPYIQVATNDTTSFCDEHQAGKLVLRDVGALGPTRERSFVGASTFRI